MLIPVVLSGGSGSRLWPISREGHPKPFIKLADGQSLLQKAYQRASMVAQGGEILTVTNRDYFFMSKDEFVSSRLGNELRASYLLEPFGRNTAPAVALAAMYVQEKFGADACLLVLAADHLIQDQQGFIDAVENAKSLALDGKLVTFGIVPDRPEVGFGYIEVGDSIGVGKLVSRFVEKPDLETANSYLASGNFLWNAGMFCFKAGQLVEELECCAPKLFEQVKRCWDVMRSSQGLDGVLEISPQEFESVEDIPIDYALMERSANIAVVPTDFGWSDIGSWNALSQLVKPDGNNNRAVGEAVFVDSSNVFVQSEDRLVAALGVSDLMIVDTADALLVVHPDHAQNVKKVVTTLKKRGHEAYKLHRTVIRPWGTYTVLEEGSRFKIKRIEVRPGASLSLQMHHHRSEHWIVVSGMAKVVNGDREIFIGTNESTYIPAGHKHRLENPGVIDLVMIEVQSGEYLGEDDIVRFEDQYGRV
jgi:mannose-1-phosphate guanylyltransferase/mannose-6-phosphate isomerase